MQSPASAMSSGSNNPSLGHALSYSYPSSVQCASKSQNGVVKCAPSCLVIIFHRLCMSSSCPRWGQRQSSSLFPSSARTGAFLSLLCRGWVSTKLCCSWISRSAPLLCRPCSILSPANSLSLSSFSSQLCSLYLPPLPSYGGKERADLNPCPRSLAGALSLCLLSDV